MNTYWKLTHINDHTAQLCLDVPHEKMNTLNEGVFLELDSHLDELKHSSLSALIFRSEKKDCFIAGADIEQFTKFSSEQEARVLVDLGQKVFNKIAALPFPTIAFIEGVCLGGGLELALSCTFRLTTDNPKVSIGLPEVKLGLVPGWGGTQRLPRLIGIHKAIEFLVSGKTLDGVKAKQAGIVDGLVSQTFSKEGLLKFIQTCTDKKGYLKLQEEQQKGLFLHRLIRRFPLVRSFIFKKAYQSVLQKTKGQYPAPIKLLELLEKTSSSSCSLQKGLQLEADAICSLFFDPVCRHLIDFFFKDRTFKKNSGLTAEQIELFKGFKKREFSSPHVYGAGVMGGGIAWLLGSEGLMTQLHDIQWDSIAKAYETADKILSEQVKKRKMTPDQKTLQMHRIHSHIGKKGLKNCDILFEAVPENEELKVSLFEEIEQITSQDTILSTNTSSIPITKLAQKLHHKDRFIGIHFFNPVHKMPLVEIIPGKETSPETIFQTVELMKKLKKVPVVVGDCCGFLVNRILIPSLNEIGFLLEEGCSPQQIEQIVLEFGMPMGPLRLCDEVGLDVAVKVAHILKDHYGQRMEVPSVFSKLIEKGWIGKKVNKGFYEHLSHHPQLFKGSLDLIKAPHPSSRISKQIILERYLFAMINEAALCLQEGIACDATTIDLALVYGIGFPVFQGGLLKYADQLGIRYVVEQLNQFSSSYGERFKPAQLLLDMAQQHSTFYAK